jgi:hypothetical protein
MGKAFAESGLFGVKTPAQGIVLAMACLAEKQSPIAIINTYHIIANRLSMRADAMLARFRQRGGRHRIVTRTGDVAEVELTLDGEKQSFRFTLDEAKKEPFYWDKAGKTPKDNWATPRGAMQMLWARVVSDGVRAMAPEVVQGSYTPEELSDEPVEVTAPVTVSATVVETPATEPARPAATEAKTVVDAVTTAKPVEAATEAASVETKTTEPTKPVEQAKPTIGPGPTEEEREEIKTLRAQLKVADPKWEELLTTIDCPKDPADGKRKIKFGTPEQVQRLLAWLRKKQSPANTASTNTQLDQWANDGMPTSSSK